jgi:hypothetical protein
MAVVLMDPTGELEPAARATAPRLATLDGATVGLLDISKPRGDVFLDRIQARLNERGVATIRYEKPTYTKPAPIDLRQKIAVECQAVVEALAD